VVDFDLCFKDEDARPNPFADLAVKLAMRPKAIAIVNHREHAKGFRERDPERNKTLTFATGAKIIGMFVSPAPILSHLPLLLTNLEPILSASMVHGAVVITMESKPFSLQVQCNSSHLRRTRFIWRQSLS
jgi:hypothetical protein